MDDAEPLRFHFPSWSSWDSARYQLEQGSAGADIWRAPHDLVSMVGAPPPVLPPAIVLSVQRFTYRTEHLNSIPVNEYYSPDA